MKKIIPELFSKAAAEFKDKIVFNYFDQEWKTVTYDELLINTKGVASYLINNGTKKGDSVAIISENRPEWCAAYLGISLAGGIAVPIDVQLGTDEIRNLLADSKSKIVFHSSKTGANVTDAIKKIAVHDSLFVTPINFDTRDFIKISRTSDIKDYPAISEEDVASIIYTSGTTGIPKGVMLTHKSFCSDAEALIKAGILSADDSVLGVLPLHHTYPFMGTLLIPVFLGIPITYPQSLKGPDLMAAIRDKGVTILVSVPQLLELIRNGVMNKIKQLHRPLPKIMLRVLKICGSLRRNFNVNLGKIVFKSVHRALGKEFRFFACGGAKLDPDIMKDLEALGLTVLEGYGLTETSPVVTFNPIEKRKAGSAGRPLPSAEIKIIDPGNHKELKVMEEGEIAIKGPMVMKGYYKNPKATEEVLRDGWFYSGDLGYLDNDGYLFITGRSKEVIVLSSGKNIYPDEAEKQYLKIPLIKEICVLGLEETGMVESLQAIIVPDFEYARKEQIGNLQDELRLEIKNVSLQLPQYMRLKGYMVYPDPLPRTPLGKLRRFMVKDLIKVKSEKLKVKSKEDRKLLEDDVGRKIVECIKPLLKEQVPIRSTDNLELDLGFDSLAKIELVVALEKTFSVKLPDTFTSEIQTVGELVVKLREFGTGEIGETEKIPVWKGVLLTEPELGDKEKVGLHHGFFDRLITSAGLGLIRAIMKVFFRLKVEGIENLPQKGPYIIAPNHASYLDGFAIGSVVPSKSFKDLYIIGFQKLFTGKFREDFARLAHIIPIDPEIYLTRALQMASFILGNGKALLIFPEGGRSYDGELMGFKKGVGILSLELNIPVIPAYIQGALEALPRQARWPKFTAIKVTIGKPLQPSDMDLSRKPDGIDTYQFFVNELREKVRALKELK